MNDIRRTILWVIFGFALVLLWDKWQVHNGKQATFFPTPGSAVAPAQPQPARPAASGVPAVPGAVPAAMGAGAAGASAVPTTAPDGAAAPAAHEKVVVTTDVMRLTFDSLGGSLTQAEMLKYADMADKSKNFVLFDQSPERVYLAQTGLIGGNFPTHKTPMAVVPGARTLSDGQDSLSVRFESPSVDGLQLVKTWTIQRGSYALAVQHEIINTGAVPLAPQLYLQLVRDGNKPPGESSIYSTFTGPAVYTAEKKYQKVDFKKIDEGKVDIEKTSPNGYVAMVQHYFASAWLLGDGIERNLFMRKVDTNLYSVGMITALGNIAPGASKTLDARLYAGPQIETKLEALTPGLELVKDYVWLTILAKPLYWLLDKIHSFLGN